MRPPCLDRAECEALFALLGDRDVQPEGDDAQEAVLHHLYHRVKNYLEGLK